MRSECSAAGLIGSDQPRPMLASWTGRCLGRIEIAITWLGIRSAARADTFHRQEIVTEPQGRTGRKSSDAEAGREIPHGTDEESTPDDSRDTTEKSAKTRTDRSGASRTDRDR